MNWIEYYEEPDVDQNDDEFDDYSDDEFNNEFDDEFGGDDLESIDSGYKTEEEGFGRLINDIGHDFNENDDYGDFNMFGPREVRDYEVGRYDAGFVDQNDSEFDDEIDLIEERIGRDFGQEPEVLPEFELEPLSEEDRERQQAESLFGTTFHISFANRWWLKYKEDLFRYVVQMDLIPNYSQNYQDYFKHPCKNCECCIETYAGNPNANDFPHTCEQCETCVKHINEFLDQFNLRNF